MQFERDQAAGCAPESEFLTDPARTRFTIPGVDYSSPAPSAAGGSVLGVGTAGGGGGSGIRPVRGSSRLAKKAAASNQDEDMFAVSNHC